MNAVKFPIATIIKVDIIILLFKAYLIPDVNPEYLFFSIFAIDSLGILWRKIKFTAFIIASAKYNFSKLRKFIKYIPIFGPKNHAVFKRIIFKAIPDFNLFFLSKFAKYDCLDEISIDINIPDKKVRKKITDGFTSKKKR